MDISTLLIFFSIVLIGAIVQGISGFAYSMVVLMVFPYLFGYTQALTLASLMGFLLVIYNAYLYRKYIDWKWIPWWMAIYFFNDLLSVLVLKQVGDDPIWYTLMGVIFIVMALYLLFGKKFFYFRADIKSLVVLSSLSGLIMGAFGVGGPLMATFFLEATKGKEEYLGTTQVIGAGILGTDFFMRLFNGMFTVNLLGFTMIGIVFMIIGLLIAKKLVSCMDASNVRKFICLVMIVDGMVMLFHH